MRMRDSRKRLLRMRKPQFLVEGEKHPSLNLSEMDRWNSLQQKGLPILWISGMDRWIILQRDFPIL